MKIWFHEAPRKYAEVDYDNELREQERDESEKQTVSRATCPQKWNLYQRLKLTLDKQTCVDAP